MFNILQIWTNYSKHFSFNSPQFLPRLFRDHVDDVIFVDAVQNTIPRPTKMWDMPGLEEVDNYINNPVNKEKVLSIEGLCSNCLGFYLVIFNVNIISRLYFLNLFLDSIQGF